MPFMKAKINQLFSNTMKIHELKLQKETTNRSELIQHDMNKPEIKKPSKQKNSSITKKRDELSKEKKIEVLSKHGGFKKKLEPETNRYETKGLHKRNPIRDDSFTNRSIKQPYSESHEKGSKNSYNACLSKNENSMNSKKSVYEEEQTLQEQGYGVLIRDMKRYIKGGSNSNSKNGSGSMKKEAEESYEHGYSGNSNKQIKITPKYLEMETIPGVTKKDTLGSKIEALRMYLQKQIGE